MEWKRIHTETVAVFMIFFLAFPIAVNFLYVAGFMEQLCVRNCDSFITEWLPILKRTEWLYASSFLGTVSAVSFFIGRRRGQN